MNDVGDGRQEGLSTMLRLVQCLVIRFCSFGFSSLEPDVGHGEVLIW